MAGSTTPGKSGWQKRVEDTEAMKKCCDKMIQMAEMRKTGGS